MFLVARKKMYVFRVAHAALDWVLIAVAHRQLTAVLEIPRVKYGGWVVLDMLHVPPAFKQERLQPFGAKFLRRPSPTDSRTDNNGIVLVVLFDLAVYVCHSSLRLPMFFVP